MSEGTNAQVTVAVPDYFTLNDGKRIPSVGLGCWMGGVTTDEAGGERVHKMCTAALERGYRHLDTASGYGLKIACNEAENGDHGNVLAAFNKSQENLGSGIEYIDMYLLHWPLAVKDGKVLSPDEKPTFVETWKAMEQLLETGKVKSIGVSNFSIKTLDILLPHCTIIPATNQIELHPCLPQNDLKEYCEHEDRKILLTAYSPLESSLSRGTTFMENATIQDIAKKLGATPAQVVLSWSVARGTAVAPKSENPERMVANLTLIPLSSEDRKVIDELHQAPGMHKSLLGFHEKDGSVFGWTYEQLGWNMIVGGIVPTK
ncbi:aldo/keto reductase [Mycena maculata]|uniref:Aldo/keto reductase n=1 Tax=Mycena maculata TaxID=230809 RepID=A0AAD7HXI9_9AGAR|nr:aldo/keto reductase [Mycena maculata]